MENTEATFHPPMIQPSSYTAVEERLKDVPQTSCEAVLSRKEALARVYHVRQVDDITKNLRRNIEDRPEDRQVGDKSKAAVKHFVTSELTTLV